MAHMVLTQSEFCPTNAICDHLSSDGGQVYMVDLLLFKLLDLSCLKMQFCVPIYLAEALTKPERKSETTVEEVQPDMMSTIVRVEVKHSPGILQ